MRRDGQNNQVNPCAVLSLGNGCTHKKDNFKKFLFKKKPLHSKQTDQKQLQRTGNLYIVIFQNQFQYQFNHRRSGTWGGDSISCSQQAQKELPKTNVLQRQRKESHDIKSD